MGTYGFIKDANAFLVGAIKKSDKTPGELEDYGFLMQENILFATDIDLGTCWLGASFTGSSFGEKISIEEDENMPGISPIGYRAPKRGTVDNIIRWSAGSKNRKHWSVLFFNNSFSKPLFPDQTGNYSEILEMVRLAPSASNKQPWRIIKESEKNIFHFFLQRTKNYHKNQERFNTADLQRIDMGIAMCHFQHSAEEHGIKGKWLINEPDIGTLPEDTTYLISWIE